MSHNNTIFLKVCETKNHVAINIQAQAMNFGSFISLIFYFVCSTNFKPTTPYSLFKNMFSQNRTTKNSTVLIIFIYLNRGPYK